MPKINPKKKFFDINFAPTTKIFRNFIIKKGFYTQKSIKIDKKWQKSIKRWTKSLILLIFIVKWNCRFFKLNLGRIWNASKKTKKRKEETSILRNCEKAAFKRLFYLGIDVVAVAPTSFMRIPIVPLLIFLRYLIIPAMHFRITRRIRRRPSLCHA